MLTIYWDWNLHAELEDRLFGLVFNSPLHKYTDGAFKCPDCSHVLMICSQDLVWIFFSSVRTGLHLESSRWKEGREIQVFNTFFLFFFSEQMLLRWSSYRATNPTKNWIKKYIQTYVDTWYMVNQAGYTHLLVTWISPLNIMELTGFLELL